MALLLVYISLSYGEGQRSLGVLALLGVAAVAAIVAVGVWKFGERTWVRRSSTVVTVLMLVPLALVVQMAFPWIVLALYQLGGVFVVVCIVLGTTIWVVSTIREAKRKMSARA